MSSDAPGDLHTKTTVQDGVVRVEVFEQQKFRGLDGDVVTAPVKVREVKVGREDVARKMAHSLLAYAHEADDTGPPGQKPMHQQYAEMEPPR